MKNKDKKIISLMVIMTLVLTMVIGPINPISIVKAEGTKSVKIKDILNEDELVSDDEKLLLSKTGEKISDDEFKVTLKVKGNNEESININNAIIEDALNSSFEIVEDSIDIVGIENKENVKVTTDETKQKMSIELGNVDAKEIEVSFLLKVKDHIEVMENIDVSLETKLTYNELENEENIEISFPKLTINLEEVKIEESITNENIETEIIEDIAQETIEEDVIEEEIKETTDNIENEVIEDIEDITQGEVIEETTIEEGEGVVDNISEEVAVDIIEEETNNNAVESIVTDNEPTNIEVDESIRNENNINTFATGSSQLTIDKTAELIDDETAKITLKAEGEVTQTAAKNADIVLVIDKSASMKDEDKIEKVKTAAKNFASNILSNTAGSDVRVAIVTYDYSKRNASNQGASSNLALNFSNNEETINSVINSIKPEGGTNTQDGIWRAANTLNGARADAKKYVVFFTDGLPTQSHSGGTGTTSDDLYFKDAQKEYYKNFLGWNSPKSVVIGGIESNSKSEIVDLTKAPYNNPSHSDTKFYSVGLFTNASYSKRRQAINFLKTIQNVIEPSKFSDKYYTQNLNNIDSIFTDISNDIAADINNTIATNVVINDIVTDYFNIKENSWKVTDLKGNVINADIEVNEKVVDGVSCDSITFKIGDIVVNSGEKKGGVIVTFDIKLKDTYFGGEEIETNVLANITYNNGKNDEFNIPTVDIPFKQGTITIKKEIVEKNILGQWNKISDDKVDLNDKFSISIAGNQKYTVDLIGNNEETLNFYLRGENTDISTNTDKSLNYFTVGEYKIEELIPMNYEQVGIWVQDGEKLIKLEKWEKYDKNTNTFTIDKDNNNITFIVKNTLVNESYWFDKADKENIFQYYAPIIPQQLNS